MRLIILPLLLCHARAFQHLVRTSRIQRSSSPLLAHQANGDVPSRASKVNGDLANGDKKPRKEKRPSKDDPSKFLTYRSGRRNLRFTINQADDIVESFRKDSSSSGFRRRVILPDSSKRIDVEKRPVFNDLIHALNEKTPVEWDLERMAQSARRNRLLNNRAYAKPEPFMPRNIAKPPGLSDLSPPEHKGWTTFWITTPARLLSFAGAYAVFPYMTRFLHHFVTMEPSQLDEITSKFGPGISILYGTFISLTLSILYSRQQEIQDDVALESCLLVYVTRNLLSLFRSNSRLCQEAGQCAADQIRTLVKGSRGGELILLMYSDPYARMLELVDCFEETRISEGKTDLGGKGNLIASCRDGLKDLFKQRATRLSNEALALPSTHFFILQILTALIFVAYSASILPTVDKFGNPPNEASLIFGALVSIYVIFYNFANDLNNPFAGVYQVRRSATASHLLELKWLIANHPVLKGKVDFEEVEECDRYDGDDVVLVRSPGLGDLIFERADLYPEIDKEETSK